MCALRRYKISKNPIDLSGWFASFTPLLIRILR
jgi:hypothetical protein